MTDFCGIPLATLRENALALSHEYGDDDECGDDYRSDLHLEGRGMGTPGAIVLSSLLPSSNALKSLKYVGLKWLPFPY